MEAKDFLQGVEAKQAAKEERFEKTILKRLLVKLGVGAGAARELTVDAKVAEERLFALLDDRWTSFGFSGQFPWYVMPRRITSFSIEDIFKKPKKSPVVSAFLDVEDTTDGRMPAMPFRVGGFGIMVMLGVTSQELERITALGYSAIMVPATRGLHRIIVTEEAWIERTGAIVSQG